MDGNSVCVAQDAHAAVQGLPVRSAASDHAAAEFSGPRSVPQHGQQAVGRCHCSFLWRSSWLAPHLLECEITVPLRLLTVPTSTPCPCASPAVHDATSPLGMSLLHVTLPHLKGS